MYCSQCGKEVKDGASFCSQCGAPLKKAAAPHTGFRATPSAGSNAGFAQNAARQNAARQNAVGQNAPAQNAGFEKYTRSAEDALGKLGATFTNAANAGSVPEQNTTSNRGSYGIHDANSAYAVAQQQGLGMIYHKFMVYIALILSIAGCVIAGLLFLFGRFYGLIAASSFNGTLDSYFYQAFPGMRIVDVVAGIVLLAYAAMCFLVRQNLAGFKRGAPQKLIGLYIVEIVLIALYIIVYMLFARVFSSYGPYLDYFSAVGQIIGNTIGIGIWLAIGFVYYKKRAHLFVC